MCEYALTFLVRNVVKRYPDPKTFFSEIFRADIFLGIYDESSEANDNAVYDEILLLQRFLGQPQANLSSIRRDYQTGIQV